MTVPELVLHVGFQQSGATMLQRALERLRPQLRRHGVAFVRHRALANLPDSARGWECHPATQPDAVRSFDAGVARLVSEESAHVEKAGRRRVRTVVVSSDHLLGSANIGADDGAMFRPFAVPGVAQVIRALQASRVRVVLYTRRQDRLMEFAYLRQIQQGATHDFAEQFPYRHRPVLDYGALLRRLGDLPQVMDVHVRPFELVSADPRLYTDDVLGAVDLDGELDLDPVGSDLLPYRVYSRRALDIALDVNGLLESDRERQLMRTFLKQQFPGTDDRSTRVLPERERARILNAHAPANRRLFERFMPDLPVDAYAYADDDAGDALGCTGQQAPSSVSNGAPGTT